MFKKVGEYFECPSCHINYERGEEIQVGLSAMGIGAYHYCDSCNCKIELLYDEKTDTVKIY